MIVEYIRYRIPADQATAFEDAYRAASASLDDSPHCERYDVARCADDPSAYVARIEWDSLNGHMNGFRSSPQFADFSVEFSWAAAPSPQPGGHAQVLDGRHTRPTEWPVSG